MSRKERYPQELHERAVRMLFEHRGDCDQLDRQRRVRAERRMLLWRRGMDELGEGGAGRKHRHVACRERQIRFGPVAGVPPSRSWVESSLRRSECALAAASEEVLAVDLDPERLVEIGALWGAFIRIRRFSCPFGPSRVWCREGLMGPFRDARCPRARRSWGEDLSLSDSSLGSMCSRHGCGRSGSHLTRSRGPTSRLKRWETRTAD